MNLTIALLLASGLFCIGLAGLLTRKHAIALILSVELMVNGEVLPSSFVKRPSMRSRKGSSRVITQGVASISGVVASSS